MSNVGQAALIVVGTVVGAYLGYPQLGFVLGSLAGSALFPTQLPPGPRISDTRTTTSAVGGPVPFIFGTCNVAGTVMWLAPYVEHSTEQGGKGGPEQQTFSYTQSIAVLLAERVDDDADDTVGAIGGITRIWENGAIVYDIRPQQPGNSALNLLPETDLEYQNRLTASAAYAETFTLYLGDELQEADPTIEATQGVGQVPAFRALAYIVYPNRNLTIAQGLRHPNFQFEVFQHGTGDCTSSTLVSTQQLFPWAGGSAANPINLLNTNAIDFTAMDADLPGYHLWTPGTIFADEGDALALLSNVGYGGTPQYIGYAYNSAGNFEIVQTGGVIVSDTIGGVPDPQTIVMTFNFQQPPDGLFPNGVGGGIPVKNVPLAEWWITDGPGGTGGIMTRNSGSLTTGSAPAPPVPFPRTDGSFGSLYWLFQLRDATATVTRSPSAPRPLCQDLPPSAIPGFAIQADGTLINCAPWQLFSDPGNTVKVLQTFQGSNPQCIYPLNPCLLASDPNYSNATYWTNAYTQAVTAGQMAAGKTYNVDYPVHQNFYWQVPLTICQAQGDRVSIADIIKAVCKRSGLLAVDVSDLEATFVNGYAIATICTGSSIITPLRSIGFFDCVETDGLITFPTRGKPVVATFTTDDFGCYDPGAGTDDASGASTCPPSITTARAQDEDLPRSIRLHYIATSRDYEDAEQDSSFRFATKATNDVDVSVPVCLDDTTALQCASVLWADAWAARSSYELSIDQSWLPIDVADCLAVPVDSFIQRMRIANDTNSSAVLRKLSCVKDDEGAYISFAIAEPPMRVPQKLTFIGATAYELMDLPCLQDADSDPGFYIAAQHFPTAGTWKGATFYESTAGGTSFSALQSLLTETPAGTIDTAIPASQTYTWDDYTVITVNIAASSGYTFESLSDDAVLAGGNGAAMGADGRWEIVQFANAEQLTPTQWQLSRLLRGRRGTEHVVGLSVAADAFVMVSLGTIGRNVLETSQIGASFVYRGTSIGASFASGTTEAFTGHGQALVCFSPVNAAAERITDGDLLISWVRRSRLGRTLMSGVDIPLGEATEAYQIDILEGASPNTVLRTLSATTSSVRYPRAEQEADFGSPLPSTVDVAIYQMSAITGRGTPFLGTLTISEV